jgi:metal-responsive CopG/Arc/MetJ family transcriptional regulator
MVIPGYTHVVKTAISVPDDIFDRASRRAKALGLSRSEFFARAADKYLDELDAHSVTRQVDAALEECGALDDSNAVAVEAAHGSLRAPDDQW